MAAAAVPRYDCTRTFLAGCHIRLGLYVGQQVLRYDPGQGDPVSRITGDQPGLRGSAVRSPPSNCRRYLWARHVVKRLSNTVELGVCLVGALRETRHAPSLAPARSSPQSASGQQR